MKLEPGQIRFIFVAIAVCTLTIPPFSYWVMHPELTQMQIFTKFWWIYIASTGVMGIGYLFQKDV